ncbi:MAG: HAMP domain-containing histidine kinase [Actinobacteria bacterium]|nr:HAMP domain-containing histidine kinase [Actinomycetota bacterium]
MSSTTWIAREQAEAFHGRVSWAVTVVVAFSGTTIWLLAVILAYRVPLFVSYLVGGSLSLIVLIAALLSSFGAVMLWKVSGHQPRWLILGVGLLVVACSEGALGIRQLAAAYALPLILRSPLDSSLPTSGLLASAVVLVWLASLLPGHFVSLRRWPGVVPVGLAMSSVAAWVAASVLGTWFAARLAGATLALVCLIAGVWLVLGMERKWRLTESLFALTLLMLCESGLAQAVMAPATLAATVCSGLLRVQALACCGAAIVHEFTSATQRKSRALAAERHKASKLAALLSAQEMEWRSATHQVRSALLLIHSGLELLSEGHSRLDARTIEALEFLKQAAGRVSAAVGVGEDLKIPFDLRPVLQVEIAAARRRDLKIRCLAPTGKHWKVYGNPTVLARIVGELLDNAARHAPGCTVTVTLAQESSSVVVTVADDGPGASFAQRNPNQDLPKLEASKAHSSGGLGLVLARRLIEDDGGTLVIDHSRSGGTVATICMPRAEDDLSAFPSERVAQPTFQSNGVAQLT